MRLGCCASLDGLEAVRQAGFAYVEPRVVDLAPDDDEAVYAPIRRRIQDAGLPAEAFNVLFRRTTRLWGPDAICPRCAPTWTPPWVAWPSWGLVSSFSAAVRHGRRRRDMTGTGCPARFSTSWRWLRRPPRPTTLIS